MKNSLFLRLFLAAGLMFTTCAATARLTVGDQAPKLQTGKWIQGEPVEGFDSNHIYIVEFWATWCGPCIQSIPHLNALWEKFKDKNVIVIGQDVGDLDDAVSPFVEKMGTNMTYRVALDDKSQNTNGFMCSQWVRQEEYYHGIPSAMIINKEGMIVWIGHPMALNEQLLDDIISGRFDMATAKAAYKEEFAAEIEFNDLRAKLIAAMKNKDWDTADSTLNDILKNYPKNNVGGIRLQILLGQKKLAEAYQLADSLSKAYPTDYWAQNELAWTICTSDNVNKQGLVLAEKMTELAENLTGGTNSAPFDTSARIQFMLGKKDEAVISEEKAMAVAPTDDEKAALEKILSSYKNGKLSGEND